MWNPRTLQHLFFLFLLPQSSLVARHFNLPNHSKEHMSICGLSLHQGTTDSRKNLEQRFIFQIGTPRHERMLFIQLIYSCFSRNLVSTNSIAPCSVYKPYTTHNSSIRSDEGLTLETSAFQSLHSSQFTLSTALINQIYIKSVSLCLFFCLHGHRYTSHCDILV